MATIPRMTAGEMRRINKARRQRGDSERYDPSHRDYDLSADGNSTLIAYTGRRGWRPPKLTREGQLYTPKVGEVGSWVTSSAEFYRTDGHGFETREVTGQVWARSCHHGEVWIVRTLPSGDNIATSVHVSELRAAADPAYAPEHLPAASIARVIREHFTPA